MSSEQAKRVTHWRRERRWEMVQLKDRQQQETKGKLLISPMPDVGTGSGSFPEPNARSHH